MLMLGVLCLTTQLLAQNRTISGRITNEQGEGIANASITVKGTTNGTVTNATGNFSLSIPSSARTLVVSSVGFQPREISIGSQNTYELTLSGEAQDMNEVVVVAYGTQKRESITGSVATVGAKQLETRLTTNITQALAGAAPGIAATSGNGQPGSSAAIRIRGFGSINASSAPLFVVDGFPYEGFIGDLNTNDIESISLLKDASSTALYGARAANGVVLITTKKGKTADPKVNINFTTGFTQRGIPEYDRVGTNDYYPVMWQALKNSLMYPTTGTGLSESAAALQASNTIAAQLMYNPYNVANDAIVGTDGKLNPNAKLLYDDFDWFGPIAKNGARNEVAMSTSAKMGKSDYYISLNYLKDEGFILKSDYERASVRLNLNSQVKSWLRTGVNMSGVLVKANNASAGDDNTSSIINPFVFARRIGPIYPVRAFDAAGQPVLDAFGTHMYDYGQHTGAINRPQGAFPGRHVIYETMLNESVSTRNSLIARTFLEAKFLRDFTFTTNLGLDLNNTRTKGFQNKIVGDGVTAGGTASRSSNEFRTISMNQLLNYKKSFGGRHDLSVLVGHENQWVDEIYFSGSRRGMNFDGNQELVNFVTLNGITGSIADLRRDAYLSRINYDLDNKYFVELSYRRDGSSRFAPKSRWGNFYSAGASWFINREDFLSNVNWLSDLKLRLAYGTVGNDALGSYYEYQALYGLGWNNAAEPGALASSIKNEDLTWEVNKQISLGVDFGLFKNRISGSIEMFDRGASRLLFDVPIGLSSIVTTRTENIGAMSNKGIEIQLNGNIIQSKDFNWSIQLNGTSLKNEITKLPGGQPITNGTKRLEEGKDIYNFYLRQWYGVDPNDGAGLYYALPGTSANYRVIKGDTLVTNPTLARYDYSGSAIPAWFGSVGSNFEYKGIGLSFLLNYQLGGKFYDGNYAGLLGPSYGATLHADVLKAWQKPGDVTDMPRLDISSASNFNAQSNRWLIDASYLSFRNVTVSYGFDRSFLGKLGLSQLKLYVSGENIAVLSKRKGMNPAESFNGTNSAIYTPNRAFSAGINVSF